MGRDQDCDLRIYCAQLGTGEGGKQKASLKPGSLGLVISIVSSDIEHRYEAMLLFPGPVLGWSDLDVLSIARDRGEYQ